MTSAGVRTRSSLAMSPWRRGAIIVGLLVLAAAAGLAALHFAFELKGRIASTRTPVPGRTETELAKGKYDIYFELPGAIPGFGPPHGMTVSVAPVSGKPLPLAGYSGQTYVGSTGSLGLAIKTVEVPRSGRYVVSAGGNVGSLLGSGATVVLGVPNGWKVVGLAASGVIALLALIGVSLAVPPSAWFGLIAFLARGGHSPRARALRALAEANRAQFSALGQVAGGPGAMRLGSSAPRARQAPVQGAAAVASVVDRLGRLADLRDKGVLSDEEFEAQKRRILGE